MPLLPFRVLEPPGEESPLLVEVPHAGLVVDDGTRASCVAPPRSIEKDADRYVDELYADAPRLGATLLVATYSRYVVDLNRAETDVDGGSVRGIVGPMRASRGVVCRLTGDGLPVLAAPLEPAELERRLATVYRPYHEALYRIFLPRSCFFSHSAYALRQPAALGRADVCRVSRVTSANQRSAQPVAVVAIGPG